MSQGIANARKLGLLTDGNVANFRLLLEIRNTFAHEVLSNISFQSDLIRAKVARLELPDLGAVPDLVEELNKDPEDMDPESHARRFASRNRALSDSHRQPIRESDRVRLQSSAVLVDSRLSDRCR